MDGGATNWPVRDCRSFSWLFVGHAREREDFSLKASRSILLHCGASAEFIRSNYQWRGARTKGAEWWNVIARNTVYSVGARWAGILKRGGTGWMTGKVGLLAHSHSTFLSWTDVYQHACCVAALPSKVKREREREREKIEENTLRKTPGNIRPYTPPLLHCPVRLFPHFTQHSASLSFSLISSRARIKSTSSLSVFFFFFVSATWTFRFSAGCFVNGPCLL